MAYRHGNERFPPAELRMFLEIVTMFSTRL